MLRRNGDPLFPNRLQRPADPETRRIHRPSRMDLSGVTFLPEAAGAGECSKLSEPQQGKCYGETVIRYSQIDCNGHLNNCVYADLVCDFIPVDLFCNRIKEFEINFLHEAKRGDLLVISGESADGITQVSGKRGEQTCFVARIVTGAQKEE